MGVEKDSSGVNYAIFKPSIIFTSGGVAVIETSMPTKLAMPLSSLRPISGNLEQWVEGHNTKKEKQDKK